MFSILCDCLTLFWDVDSVLLICCADYFELFVGSPSVGFGVCVVFFCTCLSFADWIACLYLLCFSFACFDGFS